MYIVIMKRRILMNIPGRTCPSDYGIDSSIFKDTSKDKSLKLIYVVGGLYGNYEAIIALDKLAKSEKTSPTIIFNGDIHWFDVNFEDFYNVEDYLENMEYETILTLGNVEAEIIRETDINVGCGCSYPECVDNGSVERSNRMHSMMKANIRKNNDMVKRLKSRSKAIVVEINGLRVVVCHGDEKSLAGWMCSRENLSEKTRQEDLKYWFTENNIDVIACTHTCSAAAYCDENKAVINNGAAGMPNFKGQKSGLISRISKEPNPKAIYRSKIKDVYIEAIPLEYDYDKFIKWFDSKWGPGSDAQVSYRDRIVKGTDDQIKDAVLKGFEILSD